MHIHGGYQVFGDKNPEKDIEHAIELQKKYNGKNFAIDNIKILLDGVLESRTAYMMEPYSDKNDNYRGMLRFDVETLAATVKKANELGITIHVHTIGKLRWMRLKKQIPEKNSEMQSRTCNL